MNLQNKKINFYIVEFTSVGINRVNLKDCVILEIMHHRNENYYISMRIKSYS